MRVTIAYGRNWPTSCFGIAALSFYAIFEPVPKTRGYF